MSNCQCEACVARRTTPTDDERPVASQAAPAKPKKAFRSATIVLTDGPRNRVNISCTFDGAGSSDDSLAHRLAADLIVAASKRFE